MEFLEQLNPKLLITATADNTLKYLFFHSSEKSGLDISCRLSDNSHEMQSLIFTEK